MTARPRAWGEPPGSALIRAQPEDFAVTELPGFEPSGDGEHVFLFIEKRRLNTEDVVRRLVALSGVPARDVGFCGLKDKHAVARQWFSVGLAGRPEPDWESLGASPELRLLERARHRRKLRRGTHRGNRFSLCLRELQGERAELERRLQLLRDAGAPNYFGEQRFGRDGATLDRARRWASSGGRVSRAKRGLYLSALRAHLFNELLAARVRRGDWNRPGPGDVCMLAGSRSYFICEVADAALQARLDSADVHPGLPLWGGEHRARSEVPPALRDALGGETVIREFLERHTTLDWRPARLRPDDFSWRFCDDGSLQLEFSLGAGSYATALLAELVRYRDGSLDDSGIGSEQA